MILNEIQPRPWERADWTGNLVSINGCDSTDFTKEDIEKIVCFASTEDDWDGNTAGCILLKDGRYVAWEAFWGPTGNGFQCDAYGGTADILFARTEKEVIDSLTENAKSLLRNKGYSW